MLRWPKNSPISGMMGTAASVVDRAVVAAMQARGRREQAQANAMPHEERLERLAQVAAVYQGETLLGEEGTRRFFPVPPKASDIALRRVRSGTWEASWSSAFTPFLDDVAERYMSRVENRTARARIYVPAAASAEAITKRPAIIAIHGYMGGQWLLEENQWPIDWLVRRGLDVVLPVLPLHAARAGAHRGAPAFPSSDPRLTNEGFRQAVTDVRSLARFLRERGAPHVGVMGMSLGGYTSALTATVVDEAELDFVMPMIPLASIADFAREQGRLGTIDQVDAQHAALERANWIVSPLARPLRVPSAQALVVAAEHDQITPVAHAGRIAKHFDCEMMTIAGGHLVQIGRSDAFRALASMLEKTSVIPARRPRHS